MEPLFLGVDGGGSTTRAVVVDASGQLLARVAAGGSNPHANREVAANNLQQAIHQAAEACAIATRAASSPRLFAGAFMGIAGVVSEEERCWVRETALATNHLRADTLGIGHDLTIAHAGGLGGEPGIVLIAGTGSSCFGKNARREEIRVGGWGPLLDDIGGGYWMGLQAIRAALRSEDGRDDPTALTAAVEARFGEDAREWVRAVHAGEFSRAEIAALAPDVCRLANGNASPKPSDRSEFPETREADAAALAILENGTLALTEMAVTTGRRLGFSEGNEAVPVVFSGGLIAEPGIYRTMLVTHIQAKLHADIRPPLLPPACGAVLLAWEAAGLAVTSAMKARLATPL